MRESLEERVKLLQMLETDEGCEEAIKAVNELAKKAREAKSPAYFTYNKLLRILGW